MRQSKVQRGQSIGTYQPVRLSQPRGPVEREMVARRLARTEAGATQKLNRLRHDVPQVLDVFISVGDLARLEWFTAPGEAVMDRIVPKPLTPGLVADAMRVDGREDGQLGELLANLADPTIARQAVREILSEITTKRTLLRAICQQHGWQA